MKRVVLLLFAGILILSVFACTENETERIDATVAPVQTEPPVEVVVDDVTIPVTELIVSSPDEMPDMDTLCSMTALRLLDLTALPNTPYDDIARISQNCPDCKIIWNQKLTDGVYRSDSVSLTLPHANEEDIRALDGFSDLMYVDASGSTAYDALYAFKTGHPDIEVHYCMSIGGLTVTESEETLTVSEGVDPQALLKDLHAFDQIKTADLRKSGWDDAVVQSFLNEYPQIHFIRMIRLGDQLFDSEAEMLDLRSYAQWTPNALAKELAAFSSLKKAAFPAEWSESDVQSVLSAYPGLSAVASVTAFGKTFSGVAEEIDLSGIKMQSTEEAEALLLQLPFVRRAIMCECGLSNEQMEELCNAHPDVKFVWTLVIGKRKLRTDALGFSTKNPSKYTSEKASNEYNESVKKAIRLHEGDIEALKYCTDLEALDLGHNYLTNNDLVVISKLTKLKVLILADNKITDISILTSLQDLEYIELFMNRIQDLSPLCELPLLTDVNVCNTGTSDLTPLFNLKSAKRLWYAMNPCKRNQSKALAEALPDCLCNYTTGDETGEGWREDPRYQWMRSYFKDS